MAANPSIPAAGYGWWRHDSSHICRLLVLVLAVLGAYPLFCPFLPVVLDSAGAEFLGRWQQDLTAERTYHFVHHSDHELLMGGSTSSTQLSPLLTTARLQWWIDSVRVTPAVQTETDSVSNVQCPACSGPAEFGLEMTTAREILGCLPLMAHPGLLIMMLSVMSMV